MFEDNEFSTRRLFQGPKASTPAQQLQIRYEAGRSADCSCEQLATRTCAMLELHTSTDSRLLYATARLKLQDSICVDTADVHAQCVCSSISSRGTQHRRIWHLQQDLRIAGSIQSPERVSQSIVYSSASFGQAPLAISQGRIVGQFCYCASDHCIMDRGQGPHTEADTERQRSHVLHAHAVPLCAPCAPGPAGKGMCGHWQRCYTCMSRFFVFFMSCQWYADSEPMASGMQTGSFCVWQGVSFQLVHIDLAARPRWFTSLSGLVPLIEYPEGVFHRESLDICR